MSTPNNKTSPADKPEKRLILAGGFLGAGKTTLIGKLVQNLQATGLRCGVITNDQATGLVDTSLAVTLDGTVVSEIAGGCFCCKLDELKDTLTHRWNPANCVTPDVIIAEPVGSCTDLMATVLLPLRQIFMANVAVSPLSVIVDARRALASLGGRKTPGTFTKDVGYIYRKQIEEAEILVVNKMDLLPKADLEDLLERIEREYPNKEVFVLSARTGEGLEQWADRVLEAEASPERLMEVDYERYGTGEALLGWCNAEVLVEWPHPQDGDTFLSRLAGEISSSLDAAGMEVAHLKMALTDDDGRLGLVNQVMSGTAPEISRAFGGNVHHGLLTVNLRAEGDPEVLQNIVTQSIKRSAPGGAIREMAAFRPGQPVPVERVTSI